MSKRLDPTEKERRKLTRQLNTQINRVSRIINNMEKTGYIFSESKLRDMLRVHTDRASLPSIRKAIKRMKEITKTKLYGYVKGFTKINWETGEGKEVKGNEKALIAGKREERKISGRKKETRLNQADEAIATIESQIIKKYLPGKYEGSKYTTGEEANVDALKELVVEAYKNNRDKLTKSQLEAIREVVEDNKYFDSDQEQEFSQDMNEIYTIITNKAVPKEYQYVEDAISPVSTPNEGRYFADKWVF